MDREKIKDIFADAVELLAANRTSFVRKASEGDAELENEVISLLDASDATQNLIEENVFDLSKQIAEQGRDLTGKRFGNYRIVREIGHGGMGTVFLARRDDGEFDQDVALKIVRQSIADSLIIERFRRERQILAGLKHPNIAALYDGGVSKNSEPFLVMEHVDGKTLTDFASEADLTIKERLDLFLKICGAVDYAHRNLVVHRDIKPANILVTSDGEPKLLDFGLARSFEADSSNTQTAIRAFTPAYASPEQILGQNLTTATDVYSLGVVFYEFISGEKPLKLEGLPYEQVVQTLSNFNPVAPSQLPDLTDTTRPHRSLKGDLDNIALMAIRKEPERRYASVSAMADDIRDHLAGRPIRARPNTFGYLATRFVRRNKIAVTAALLISIAVVTGFGVALWQANVAKRESARSDAVNKFMQQMLLTADPVGPSGGKRGAEATIVDVLKQAETRLDNGELSTEPEVRADLRQIIGHGFFIQGLYDDAERSTTSAFSEKSAIYGSADAATLLTEIDLARVYLAKANYQRTGDIFGRRFEQLRSEYVAGRIEPYVFALSLLDYGTASRATGDAVLAEKLIREAVDIAAATSVAVTEENARSMLSLVLFDQGRFEEAKTSQLTMLNRIRQRNAEDYVSLCGTLTLLGSIQMESGDLTEAMNSLRDAEGMYRKLYGNEATPLYDNLRLQAQAKYLKGDLIGAKKIIDIVVAKYSATSNPRYISFATALTVSGSILNKLGNHSEAENILREALRLRTENLPPEHFMTALTKGALGEILLDKKSYADAEPLLRQSLDSLMQSQKAENPRLKLARDRVARLEIELKQKPR